MKLRSLSVITLPQPAKPVDQPLQEPLDGLRIMLLMHGNVERISICVACPPEPELHAIDRNNDFIKVPFVTGARPIVLDAIGEVAAKPIHPASDGFQADHHAALGKQIPDIRHAGRKTMIRPARGDDDLARKTVAFQAKHRARYFHLGCLCERRPANTLAMRAVPARFADRRGRRSTSPKPHARLIAQRMKNISCQPEAFVR